MKKAQIAVQVYTVRDFLKTPDDIARSLERLRAIGFEAVELIGLGAVDDATLAKWLADNGLVCCSTHADGKTILNEPARLVDHLEALNCGMAAYPYPGGIDFASLDAVKDLARRLNEAGKVLADAHKSLVYHNHHIEFIRHGDQTALECIYDGTDPRYLKAELDTYWVQHGGCDPVSWCERMQGRLPILHIKDYTVTADKKATFAEVGNGNLDWSRILPAAEAAGCQWFCVEQDVCPGDPFDSLRMSYAYLSARCEDA